jgi:hypothetical protein
MVKLNYIKFERMNKIMNKYELEQTLSKLNIVRELLFQHIPEIYAREASRETLKAIEQIKKDIENAN